MASKKSSKDKGTYQVYATLGTFEKNRKRKLERRIKAHPNDKKAIEALKNISYKRNNHNSVKWTPKQKFMAQCYASMGINGNIALEEHNSKGYHDLMAKSKAKHGANFLNA